MINPAFNLTATERVLPKLALDFTTANLDSRITFIRTTGAFNPATYVNSSGLVAAATNNQPRFDYDPVSLTCKGLLIEELRTNSVIYSEAINSWSQSGTVNVNQDATTAPDGNTTADEIVGTLTSSNRRFQTLAFTSGTTYSYSIFAKETSGSQPGFRILNAANSIVMRLDVLFTSGVPAFVNTTGATNARIENFGNGWYRISGSYIAAATENHNVTIYPDRSGTQKTVYCWGAQLEAGAFATSYIPTTSAALTRNADVATMTGTNFSDWFNASEGCISGTALGKAPIATDGPIAYLANTSLSLRFIWITRRQTTIGGVYNGTLQASLSDGTAVTVDDTVTPTLSYQVNNIQGARNGHTPVSDLSATLPTCDTLFLGVNSAQDTFLNGWLKKINYYPQWLSAANVQAISKAT